MATSAQLFENKKEKKTKTKSALEYAPHEVEVVSIAACSIPANSSCSLLETSRKTSLQIPHSGLTPQSAGNTRLPSHQACFVSVKLT